MMSSSSIVIPIHDWVAALITKDLNLSVDIHGSPALTGMPWREKTVNRHSFLMYVTDGPLHSTCLSLMFSIDETSQL
jgi:hypothetical protein